MRHPTLLPAALAALLTMVPLGAPLRAQSATTPTTDAVGSLPPSDPRPPLSMVDGNFLNQTVGANQAQADNARLARTRAGSDGVRQFAALLERDHDQLSRQLQALVHEVGLQVPPAFSQLQQVVETRLAAASGNDFDRDYLAWVIDSHQAVIPQYQHEADASASDPLRTYARQTLPMLQAHLDRARQLQAGGS